MNKLGTFTCATLASFLTLATTGSFAAENPKIEAKKAVAVYMALAHQCEPLLQDAALYKSAKDDAILTLAAGGYSESESISTIAEIDAALQKSTRPQKSATFCSGMIKTIIQNRDSFRDKLRSMKN